MRFSQLDTPAGRQTLATKFELFQRIIAKLEDIYAIRPFNQQTPQSLLELWALATTTRPRTIIELGAGSRSSTLALALAAADIPGCTVQSIDIAPADFSYLSRTYFGELRFGPVLDNAVDASTFEIPATWPRPILMLYDAHDGDIPGVVISRHAIANWFPKLASQTIAVHDCSVFTGDDGTVYPPPHVKAIHWSGRAIVGYAEVPPLVDWMNRERVDFWRPGDALESFGLPGHDSSLIAFTAPAHAREEAGNGR